MAGPPEVVYCFDDRMALPGAVSVLSLLDHDPDARIHILTDPAPQAAPLFRAIAAARDAQIEIIDRAPERGRGFSEVSDYGERSTAAYRRLYLPDLLAGLDRAIYVDADTLVRRSLRPLWQTGLGGAPLAAVQDPWMATVARMRAAFPEGYFNAGVFLADLARWRAEGLTEAAVREIPLDDAPTRMVNGVEIGSGLAEQTPLNIATHGRWLKLSPAYNCTTMTVPRLGALYHSTPEAVAEAVADPAIVHFLAAHKPWLPEFAEMSAWHGEFAALRAGLEARFDLGGLAWPGAFTNGPKAVAARAMMALRLVQKAKATGMRRATVLLTGLLAQNLCRVAADHGVGIDRLVSDYPAYHGHRMGGIAIDSIDRALDAGDRDFIIADYRRLDQFRALLGEHAARRGVEIRIVDLQAGPGAP